MKAETAEERRSALEAFANSNGNGNQQLASPGVKPLAAPVDRVFGAQHVSVYRDEARVLQKLAALGQAAGDSWYYRYPVKNKKAGTTDWIEGPSIKLANDVARIYGNCDVDTRVIDLGDSWIIYARFTDFETGYSLTRPFQQRKSQSSMNTGNDRALDIAFQIGVSKAIRNVVVNALQTYADFAFDAAYNSLVEKIGKNIEGWRARTVQGIEKIPVEVSRVEKVVGRSVKDWTAPDVAKIIAMMKSIADGMATIEETFPSKTEQAVAEDATDKSAADEFTNKNAAQASTQDGSAAQPSPASGPAAPEPDSSQGGQTGAATAPAEAVAPKNAIECVHYTREWIMALTDADAGELRWKTERKLRNFVNITPEARDTLDDMLKEKCAELRAGKG